MRSNPRLLFASYHAYLDHSSGAALATRDLFEDLTAHGWGCRVVCGPALDYHDGRGPEGVLHEYRIQHQIEHCAPSSGVRYKLFHYMLDGVPVSQYRPDGFVAHRAATQDEGVPFLDVITRACERFRPDVVLTYGGLPFAQHLIRRVKRAGAKVVFCLHNCEYRDPELVGEADALWVPSAFAQSAYQERVGLDSSVVPWPWDRTRAQAERVIGRYVTFVNPIPVKGVSWVARIAADLYSRRPEIPFLVVEGRGGFGWLQQVPLDLSGVKNLHGMASTPRPKEFYAQSRVVLMPSLWEETFGRVAAEALGNGIPVLATRRGALPETLGGAGFLFDVPERYTDPARLMDVPSSTEAAPWVETIERLWDDEAFYGAHQNRARERARAWEPDRLRGDVEAFFRRVARPAP
ncbi:Glycosyltransferase OS=Singulisphaera acidiphila (strain ATCC BAA-1392 / DSM 18658 / VKM B-2454 / MOB10) GN=Sinac_4472 PE=4 SV=1: Glyco_trans_4_4: Glycos_transf_1 [Gemmata massiliana]|uniref:Glycosyl transferase family 1 domain-containing protein n=1 Tax=Gemmata massiliana TaxID=1210884 RepID=A0A6P2D5U9_9BACT|nr:glycosyltransferase [Gemmata massiliana]VTR95484.1 Glycosyltransferase OS=Singulisphaera acidiphila (strain ATCC BAA-1392 / DSM 18658 / VKM B-2454 / MOB10) GN=Sinac_4472 PE=4 SV=1: Glyco_trans_4_4: Glycos_transf_1 [Gemmata massiliana]